MGVDPEQPDVLVLAAVELRDAGDTARSDGVIAAENDRSHAFGERLQHHIGDASAGLGDFL